MPSRDSVTIDTSQLTLLEERDTERFWQSPSGDVVSIHFFLMPPDIEADISSLTQVRDFYRDAVTQVGGAIIEVDTLRIEDVEAIRTIIKVPQEPSGMTYVGSFILPYRDFSFVLKIQCCEEGVTGIRDATVLNELCASGDVYLDSGNRSMIGWMEDPYEPRHNVNFAYNKSESDCYDIRFPDHPLSRLRVLMTSILPTIRLEDSMQGLSTFEYLGSTPRPWWKIW